MNKHSTLRQTLALLLVVVMCLSSLPLAVFAEGEETETPEVPAKVTIAEALSAEGEVSVEGVVTYVDGKNIYVQDDTGALCAYFSENQSGIAKGDTVLITGIKKADAVPAGLSATACTKSEGMTLTAKSATIGELSSMMCRYVQLTDVEVESISGTSTTLNVKLKDSTGSVNLYQPKLADGLTLNPGDKLNVKATVKAYQGNPQIHNTAADEIERTYAAPVQEELETATLVKDASSLKARDQILIVAAKYDYAMNTAQGKNNRGQGAVTKDGEKLTFNKLATQPVQVITLENGTQDGTLAFYVDSGYLYAASSDKNYLRTEKNLSDNSSWKITIDENGIATVIAQGSYTHNYLWYNSGNKIFSCYDKKQEDIAIYRIGTAGETVKETVATPVGTESGDIQVGTEVSFSCTTEGAKIFYKIGTGEYQQYTAPIAISENTAITVKATCDGMNDSAEATFTYRAYKLVDQYTKTDKPVADDAVVIYNAGAGKVMTTENKPYTNKTGVTKNQLKAADASVSGTVLTSASELLAVLTVAVDSDGKYTFTTADGKSLHMDGTHVQLVEITEATDETTKANTRFQLETATDGWFIKADVANYNGNAQYLEYYSNSFTVYGMNAAKADIYTFQFFKKTTQKVYLDQTATPDPTPDPEKPATVSIASALAGAEADTFTVQGVVTFTDGQNIYLQDATGGICLRLSEATTDIALGDTLIGTGKRATYNKLPQLSGGTYVKSSGLELMAKETTISALKEADVCTYVKLSGVEITEIYDSNGTYANPNITVKDAEGKTIQLYKAVLNKNEQGTWEFSVGDKVDITAAYSVSMSKDGTKTYYQLRNSVATEVKLSQQTPQTTGLEDGDYIIWVPAYNKALSGNYSGYYNKGVDVKLDGSAMSGYGTTEIWTLTNQEDGTITLSRNGKNLAMGAEYTSMPLGEVNDRWSLESAGDGKWFVKNVKRNAYIKWRADTSSWCAYEGKDDATADQFALTFTPVASLVVTDKGVKEAIAQWGGMINAENTCPVPGDRYAIGDQKDTAAGYSAVVNGKTITPYVKGGSDTPLYYMGGSGLGSGSDDYMQLAVNTAGWADMTLSFRLRVSGTAPATFQLQYSADGGKTFKNFTTGSYEFSYTIYSSDQQTSKNESGTITDGVAKSGMGYQQKSSYYVSFSFDVPNGAANCEQLLIRLVPGSTSANGGTPSSGGSVRMDNVLLTGSPIVSESITSYVVADPDCEEDQAVGTELTLSSATADAVIMYRLNGGQWQTYSESNKPVLEKLPCDVEAYAKAEGKADSVVRLFHYAAGTVANVKMSPNGGSVWVPSEAEPLEVTLTSATDGATIYYMTDASGAFPETYSVYDPEKPIVLNKGFGELNVKAYAVKDGFKDSALTERTFTERNSERFSIYFGQIHSHTNISDGSGEVEDAFAYAAKADQIDFLAVTDHSNSFDNTDNGVLATNDNTSSEWNRGHAAAENATTDTFVGLYGFEMTWSNGLGHMNTYNTPGWQSRTQTEYKTYATALKNYYDTLTTVPTSISQFNHPGTTFGDFSDFAHYTEAYDELITLIEVGNGEGAIGSSGYFPSYEYYTRALDKGWHVAPTNNQDNHKGRWGDANTGRSVVLADSLNQTSIYDAMRNYRVYATEDNDLNIYYTLDGNIMGTTLSTSDVGSTVEISVDLHDATDADKQAKVEVIVNGGYSLASKESSCNATVNFTVPSSYNYYYIKITQADGDIAVTAPVWIGAVEAVGISALTAESELTVVGQEQTFNLELFNNEKKDLEIESIVFTDKATGKVLAEETNITAVPKLGTAACSFRYTFTADGIYTITATVKGTLNGVSKTYTQDLSVTVVPANITSTVIIDGTHYNDYISGYYGGNVNNAVTLAAKQSIQVKVVTDEITPEMLAECSLLVVSAPARKSNTATTGDYVAKPFEDEFIDMVAAYVKNGGNLAVCGLADYQDKGATYGASGHAAAQLNKLLAACGSTMSINDDEVYDTENNGGNAYRLYPTNFNMDSKWTEGLVEGQQYSQYSGCSVNPGKGQWLVKGFDTTCSVDSDKDGVGATTQTLVDGSYSYQIVTPMGQVVFLAAEDSGHGGTIFAAGGVFISDFEVKAELDNIWDLPYANRTIFENILGITRTTPHITKIADVRKSAREDGLGKIFVVEGYVTAGTANENNQFFDAIYLQDETGGITCFPYSELGLELGTKMRLTGYTDAYQGDIEIQILNAQILKEDKKVIAPTKVSAKEAMDYDTNGGQLLQVEGVVTKVEIENGVVSQFIVKDEKGDEAKVFIDGYIVSGTTGENTLHTFVKVGNTVSAVGLLYLHPEGSSDVSVPVLRVRNCDEIKLIEEAKTNHTITVKKSANGTIKVDKQSAVAGETVTITVTPNSGKLIGTVTVTTKDGKKVSVTKHGNGVYTFVQPDTDVNVAVTFLNQDGSPATGDSFPMAVMVIAMAASVAMAAVLLINRKKWFCR